jgi:hypothetical protein
MTQRRILLETFEFTEAELKSAMIFPEINLQLIKTLLAEKIKEKENLNPDPIHYAVFIQQEAELKGMIGILQHLVNCHEDTVKQVNRESHSQSQG